MASSEASSSHHGWAGGGVQVVFKHLATTRSAVSNATSSNLDFPEPGLDASQLDSFIDIAPHMKKLQALNEVEVGSVKHLATLSNSSSKALLLQRLE